MSTVLLVKAWRILIAVQCAWIVVMTTQLNRPLPSIHEGWTEKRLIRDLLEDYDKRSRPVLDNITPVTQITANEWVQQITVEFGLELIQILDLNEMDQVLTSSVRTLYRWIDYHFRWDPADYENITSINVPPSLIWLPDVALYNYADERLEERRECDVKVYNDGTVIWHPMAIYKSTCAVHTKHFPFDRQACRMKFGPWTYDGYRVNITFYDKVQNLSLKSYTESPEWKILGSSAIFTELRYPCCPEPYPDISFYVWIVRRPAFYNYILILPCFLLSSLTLVLFWLPPETPAKMVLGMNIFVAFFLLLLLLEDTTPSASSSFPLLGAYYCLNMGIITLSSFLSCIIVNFHFRGDNRQEVPNWLKMVTIKYGSRILFVNVGKVRDLLDNSKGLQLMTSDVRLQRATSSAMKRKQDRSLRRETSGGSDSEEQLNSISKHQDKSHFVFQRSETIIEHLEEEASQIKRKTIPLVTTSMEDQPLDVTNLPLSRSEDLLKGNCASTSAQSSVLPTHSTLWFPTAGKDPSTGPSSTDGEISEIMNMGTCDLFGSRRSSRQLDQPVESSRRGSEFVVSTSNLDVSAPTGTPRVVPTTPTMLLQVPSINRDKERQYIEQICSDVKEITKGLRYLQRIQENKERLHCIYAEWRAVGMVLDRFFFVCYIVIIILSIIFIFTQTDNQVRVGDHQSVHGH